MEDADVREIHRPLDGAVVAVGSTFSVDGHRLPYPGAPVGPPEVWIECRCVAQPASREGEVMSANTYPMSAEEALTAAADLTNPDGTPYTGALIVLVPADTDPIVAASSEPAHVTTIWMGELADLETRDTPESPQIDLDTLHQEVRNYASDLDGPVVVPVSQRGTLGDDDADVVFLEPTDSLIALRDGLLQNEQIGSAHNAVEQFPEWTPHVTLGYPDRPAKAEYDATEVTFDRISLWLGGEHYDYPMGGTAVTAAATAAEEEIVVDPDEMPEDELEDGEDEITEIPIHGVLAPEGVATGDGRGFRDGALSSRPLPLPYRYEYVSSHGGNQTSEVVTVGRIDKTWLHTDGNYRFLGAIILSKPHAQEAIEGIIDGSATGLSIDADAMEVDVSSFLDENGEPIEIAMEDMGKTPVTWYSAVRVAGVTQVPIPAFMEAYVGLGHEFIEDMDDEALAAAGKILEDCGCGKPDYREIVTASGDMLVVDISDLSEEERAQFGSLSPEQQHEFALAHDSAVFATGGIIPKGSGWRLVGEDGPEYIVPLNHPAFRNSDLLARLAKGDVFAPGTKDGPGWITHPIPTARIRRYWVRGEGAAKIGWGRGGDFYRCRRQLAKYVQNPEWLSGLCANMHKEATGIWPGQHDAHSVRQGLIAAGGVAAPAATLVASAHRVYDSRSFAEPTETRAFPMRINRETREIVGYAAQWGSCHIGIQGMCQEAPKSHSDYSYFRKGIVETDAGEQSVGLITMGIGHASERMSAARATAHYDQTDAVRAYVNIGENAYGIWYAGVLAPWVTDEDIDAMLAIRRVSGDWRNWSGRRGDLEMVGLVCVNTEGFQLAASAALDGMVGGAQDVAIGIGAVPIDDEVLTAAAVGETHEQFVARLAVEVQRHIAFKARQDAARERLRAFRQADALEKIGRI
jgi:hypothetical protein